MKKFGLCKITWYSTHQKHLKIFQIIPAGLDQIPGETKEGVLYSNQIFCRENGSIKITIEIFSFSFRMLWLCAESVAFMQMCVTMRACKHVRLCVCTCVCGCVCVSKCGSFNKSFSLDLQKWQPLIHLILERTSPYYLAAAHGLPPQSGSAQTSSNDSQVIT